jgi:hypothetical protein
MNPGTSTNTNNTSSPKLASFIEALRQKQQTKGVPGLNSPDRQTFSPFSEVQKTKELENKRIEQFHQARSKEWAGIYSAKQKQIEKRVEEIRQQLKKLAKTITEFELNINQAVSTSIASPGEYHVSFLDHIRTVIELLKKNISEANSWLSLYNQRSKKKGHYWGQAQKKGTSFTLNQERQLTTSVG